MTKRPVGCERVTGQTAGNLAYQLRAMYIKKRDIFALKSCICEKMASTANLGLTRY